ncbi:DUF1256 domain-containing protein [Desulfofarcimen acetoxidans]|uniref:DUF1256 domain-containing protein n=1 Tax=Desulfofarcimen acetoxidans TaxID=58138 RepID=UPI0012FE950E|nr:DUF1256 domain-containing protein [Desulfofarcimen acetoxidans]
MRKEFLIDCRKKNACMKMCEKLKKLLPPEREITFLCIGTDRVLADIYGPLVGSLLSDMGMKNILGMIGQPVHAKNLSTYAAGIPREHFVIAFDAMSGREENLGKIRIRRGRCYPGTGIKKKLLPVGDLTVSFNIAVEREWGLDLNVDPEMIWRGATVTAGMIVRTIRELENVKKPEKFGFRMFSRSYRQILFG